ncbi:endo-1,4-beta-xylanase 5-like [Nicotiana tabacum]|uniref:Endo-1,4-beta-xylanase 5-like n=1 Tax=Nicotiana tabacum TaxID=4097 RepID=A0AC58TF99_TOBAC
MIHVALAFGTAFGIQRSGWAIARSGCWSMLKGGFVLNISGPVELYLEANNTVVELWADSISVKPFSLDEWKFHQDQSTEKVRKARVKIQAVDSQGQPLPNATVSLAQFPVWQCNKPTHPKQQSLPRLVYFKI